MNRRNTAIILYIAGLAAVFYLSLVPDPPEIVPQVSGIDKLEHFACYLVLTFLLVYIIKGAGIGLWKSSAAAVAVMIAVGGLIEVLQSFTGRSPELADLAADALGALGGSALFLFVQRL